MTGPVRHPVPCVHCRYDVRGLTPDKPCPECGKPISDTREGTLFYSLPPSRLTAITIGTGLFGLAQAAWIIWDVNNAAAGIADSSAVGTFARAVSILCAYINHPWIPIFLLASPLSGRSGFWTPLRIAVIASICVSLITSTVAREYVRPYAGGVDMLSPVSRLCADSIVLVALVRLQRHGLLLPGRPFQSLAAGAVICWFTVLVADGLRSSHVIEHLQLPNLVIAVLTPVFMLPGAIIALLQFRELLAICRDVDADHPYTRR